MAIRVADAFEDAVKGKKFRNPETGNEVAFGSLPSGEQKKVRSRWKSKQDSEGAEDLTDDAELEDDGHEEKHDAPKQSWKDKLKGLGAKAKAFMEKAPAKVQEFVSNPEARKKALTDVTEALKKAPEKYVKNLVNTAKHEVKEFKEAGEGIKAVLKGGKMNDHQKKAFKTVATHVAIGVAAAALTASGPLAAAGAFGKGLAKHVAMKAVTKSLGNIHVLQELGHIGHGLEGILGHIASEEPDVDDVIGKYVSALVVKEIEGLTDEDVTKALKGLDEEEEED
jgi:hypothetical protein